MTRRSTTPAIAGRSPHASSRAARLHAAAPRIVAIASAAAIVYELLAFALTLVGHSNAIHVRANTRAAARSDGTPINDPASLGQLFGAADRMATQAPPTLVPLVLTGVIATADPSRGFGILGTSVTATALYAVGAAVPGGARLVKVYVDRVLLERVGRRESLRMPRNTLASASPTRSSRPEEFAQDGAPPDFEAAAEDAALAWFNGFHAEPIREREHVTGLRLRPMPRYTREYGLRLEDVLVAINGSPVTNPDRIPELLVRGGGSAALTIVRDGDTRVVTVARH